MFLVFQCYDYYPSGGANDLKGIFLTLEEAKLKGQELAGVESEVHILDASTGMVYLYSYCHKKWNEPEHYTV